MIQRIQTLYLFIVALIMAAGPFLVSLYTDANGVEVFAISNIPVLITFLVIADLALVSAFILYKKRKNQFVVNRLNIILSFFLLGFFVYQSLNLSGETVVSEKGIGMLLPIFSIVFLVLANKAIKRDEDLVKSVDRLR
jgi:hypothetical protein